ncbi:MAG: metalloregulator ArsR/SmtB family transcription factor [Deltaproteobacteria bacterium]
MTTVAATIDLLQLFADPTRVRLVALLSRHELTVAELTGILELAQSRVSTHLGKLREAGVLRDRRAGASAYYSLNDAAMPADARRVWAVIEGDLQDAALEGDRARCEAMLAARTKQQGWPDAIAGEMERHYSPGRTWESMARALVGLTRLGDVLDIGSGDGSVAQMLAPRARSISCVDQSERMIAAASERLHASPHVRCVVGDMQQLAFADASFDQVLMLHVLTSAEAPSRAVGEAMRVLRPGGDLVLSTLDEHAHPDATAAYHHRHAGFAPGAVRSLLRRAGFEIGLCEVTSRERRPPHFQVITAFASKPRGATPAPTAKRRGARPSAQ